MTRAPDVEVDAAEASLINRIHSKGLLHLGLDEVEAAYRAKALPDKWQRVTGTRMPEQLMVDITERLRRVNRLRDEAAPADPSAPGAALAFLRAVAAGEAAGVRRWLESRERRHLMEAVDEQQRSCAHLAARAGHLEVLNLLFDHGAHMDARDRFGRTPLHLACEYGREEAARLLLEAGGQPGAADRSGRTALHFAACCEDAKICRLLLAQQPDLVNSVDSHGRTCLFYSVLNVHPPAQDEITRLLLEFRSEVGARDSYGRAPLHYAAEDGKKPAVGLLLRLGADPCVEDGVDGRTPLQVASSEAVRHELRRAAGARPAAPAAQQHQAAPGAPASAEAAAAPGPAPGSARSGGAAGPGAAPAALAQSGSFQELQARFVDIMERVQQGGLEQLEHIKRPQLFTGSWMVDVDTHQKLLGQVLKNVPGPEVCMRVFNLLRPPSSYPLSRGDEHDIISYYALGREAAKGRTAETPFEIAEPVAEAGGDLMSQVSRVELLRAIHEQRRQLEAKESKAEELQQQLDKLQADQLEAVDQQEARLLKARLQKAQAQVTTHSEELDGALGESRLLEGQVRGLTKQLREEKEKVAGLLAEQQQSQHELAQSKQVQQGVEKHQAEAFQAQLERQLREAEAERTSMVAVRYELQSEVRLLQEEVRQRSSEHALEMEAQRTRSSMVEFQLRSELGNAQQMAGELQAARAEMAMEASGRKAIATEAGSLMSELKAAQNEAASLPRLEAKVSQLEWEKEDLDKHYRMLFSRYNLVGQIFLGGQQLSAAAPVLPDANVVPQLAVSQPACQSASVSANCGYPGQSGGVIQDACASTGALQSSSQPVWPPSANRLASQELEATQLPRDTLHRQVLLEQGPLDTAPAQANSDLASAQAVAQQTPPGPLRRQPNLEDVLLDPAAAQAAAGSSQPEAPQPTGGSLRRQSHLDEVLADPAAAQAAAGPSQPQPPQPTGGALRRQSHLDEVLADPATAQAAAGPSQPQPTQPTHGALRRQSHLDEVLSDPAAAQAAAGPSQPQPLQPTGGALRRQSHLDEVLADPAAAQAAAETSQPQAPQPAGGALRRQSHLDEVLADPAAAQAAAGASQPQAPQPAGGALRRQSHLDEVLADPDAAKAAAGPSQPQAPQLPGGGLRRQSHLDEVLADPVVTQDAAGSSAGKGMASSHTGSEQVSSGPSGHQALVETIPTKPAAPTTTTEAAQGTSAHGGSPKSAPPKGQGTLSSPLQQQPPVDQAPNHPTARTGGKDSSGPEAQPSTGSTSAPKQLETPDVAKKDEKLQTAVIQDPVAAAASSAPPCIVVKIVAAKGLRNADWMGKSDPYCVCHVPGRPKSKFQTPVINGNLNPEWNHEGVITGFEAGDSLVFEVWDQDFGKKDDFLGKAKLLSGDIFPNGCTRELPLMEAGKEGAFLNVTVKLALEPA